MTRKLVALLGELLVIAGLLFLAFFAYDFWFSNVVAGNRTQLIRAEVEQAFDKAKTEVGEIDRVPVAGAASEAIALVYIPKLRGDVWGTPVLSNIDKESLASGIGHYPDSDLPGKRGNFAIAGHRATNGEPFAYFERLSEGDLVFVRTSEGYFTYRLFANQKVSEFDTWVLDEKPQVIQTDNQFLITLTTCDPRWYSTQRWAWWGELVSFSAERPKELDS
jgi:sortase A